MLSIHDNGHYGRGGSGAAGCTSYYELVTRRDREALAHGAQPGPTPGESEGIWYSFGQAPEAINGQRGTPADLRAALAGDWRGQAVRNAYAEPRFMSWDLTFSSFKSASVAFAAADQEHRGQIQDAVRDAALASFREVVLPEMYVRLGHGGHTREAVCGVAIHVYEQTQSRANDPQLHVHMIVPSYAWGRDSRVHTVEMRDVYASKLAAGAVFQAELASRMQDVGYGVYRDAQGTVRVGGVNPRLEELFSQRARQIEAELEKHTGPEHYDYASAGQRALIAELTRPHHDLAWREDWAARAHGVDLQQEWERAARAHELGRAFDQIAPDRRDAELDTLAREAARDTIFGVERSVLTNKEWLGTAVGPHHRFIGELAARSIAFGARAEDVFRAAQRAEERGVVVMLERASSPGQAKITTPEMIATEQRLVGQWRELLERCGYEVTPQDVEQAIRRWEAAHKSELSMEQRAAVCAITGARAAAVVVGVAGSGKTASLEIARDAYERAGYQVRGESWTAVAKDEMARQAGIASQTMAAAQVDGRTLGPQTVTVVDEAAMVPARHLERLTREVEASGGKLVLVGDERQLQPLGPGATFGYLAREAAHQAAESSSTMQEIMRQKRAPQEVKEIAALAASGRPDAALRRADEAGRVWVHAEHDAMLRAAARDIADARMADKDAIGLIPTRSDAAQLNALVREDLRGRGLLSAEEVRYTTGEGRARHEVALAAGDRIAFTLNDYRAGVYNGVRGTVIAISPGRDVSIKLDGGYRRVGRDGQVRTDPVVVRAAGGPRTVSGPEAALYVNVPAHQVAMGTHGGYTYVTHDYCRTLPRAQGATIDRVVVAAHAESSAFSKQWGNVAFTRHREDVQVHLSAAGMRREHAPSYEPAHWPREVRREAAADRGQHAAPEVQDGPSAPERSLDEDARAEALNKAIGRLAQDRPGPSTLDYDRELRERHEPGHLRGTDQYEGHAEERAPKQAQEAQHAERGQQLGETGSASEVRPPEEAALEHDAGEEIAAWNERSEESALEGDLTLEEGRGI
jgi:conjugative relaxase-like TrwC/TraI family protein